MQFVPVRFGMSVVENQRLNGKDSGNFFRIFCTVGVDLGQEKTLMEQGRLQLLHTDLALRLCFFPL